MAKKTAKLEGEDHASTSDDETIVTQPAETTEIPEEGPDVKEDAPAEEISAKAVTSAVKDAAKEAVAEAVEEAFPDAVKVVSTIGGNIRAIDGSKFGKGETGLLTPEDADARKEAGQVEIVG